MLFLPGPSLEVCTSHSLTPSDLHKYVLHKDFPGHFLKIAVSSPHSSLAPPPRHPQACPFFCYVLSTALFIFQYTVYFTCLLSVFLVCISGRKGLFYSLNPHCLST